MKISRLITYEGTEEQLRRQMDNSFRDGVYKNCFITDITVETTYTDVPHITGHNPDGWNHKIDEVGA